MVEAGGIIALGQAVSLAQAVITTKTLLARPQPCPRADLEGEGWKALCGATGHCGFAKLPVAVLARYGGCAIGTLLGELSHRSNIPNLDFVVKRK